MIYKIEFTYTDPETGKIYALKGIKEGSNPGEAVYYFKKKYPRHEINITDVKPI